jgi:RHS repeat-associated protein
MQNIVKRARMLAGVVGLVGLTLGSGPALADSLTRTTTFTYDANTGLMTQSVVEPSNVTFRVQSDFEHDAFGNVKKTTVSGSNIATRISQAGFDTQGRFPTTFTNALNHVTAQAFSAAFGEMTSVTDPNLVQSTVTLDTWGRKTLVVNGDLTKTVFQYQYCSGVNGGTVDCIGQGLPNAAYRIVAMPQDASGNQIGQIVTTYFDRLDREIAKDGQGLNGEPTRVATQYDALGRVLRTSRPYFLSTGAPLWTTFTYDALDRLTKEVRPDAGEIEHAYHGLSVTDTNQLDQTLTTVKNSRGEVISATDNLNGTTSFAYDPFGNLETTTDPASNVISNSYDLYGRKIAMSDPDMGNWSYGYDVLGQLTSQTNARNQTVTLTYDKLGRLTGRGEPDLTSSWTYDTQTKGIGKLATASTTAGFQRTVSYDSLSRPVQTAVTVDSSIYSTISSYNSQGKIGTVTYPSGFALTYSYNTIGYLTSVNDGATSAAYWTANAYDAELHLTQQTFGNGVVTYKVYTPETGRIVTIQAGAGNAVQNLGFTFNTLGNLTQRVDAVTQTTDDLSYDGLNRLTQATVSNPSLPLNVTKTVAYDAIGNITAKSDVGTYTYDPARVHAVASIGPGGTGTVTASYTYDANGNMLEGRGRTVTWTSFDMVDEITQGTNSVAFTYDSEHARLKQLSSDGSSKTYLNDPISGIMAEKIVGASLSVTWNNYIMLGGEMVALKVTGAATQTRYFHKDHLGSIVALTDETGAVVERNSFDAWGQRRTPFGQDDPLYPGLSITSQITRGYTGHEQLDSVGLVHMNGRIYDPVIGKMLSPDPNIQFPYDGQSYNRYSYVQNNPLSLTDPTGFFLDTVLDVVSLAVGVASLVDNLAQGNYGAAAVDAGTVVADAILAATPFATAGVSLGVKASREGVSLVDDLAAMAAKQGDEAKETAEQLAKGADEGMSAAQSGGAKFGTSTTTDYAKTFRNANPSVAGKVVVHHAVPQHVLSKYPGVVTKSEIHSLENLRGIPKDINGELHQSTLKKEWNKIFDEWDKMKKKPTKQELLDKATELDRKYGDRFDPPHKGSDAGANNTTPPTAGSHE